jgi:hypothetical protein
MTPKTDASQLVRRLVVFLPQDVAIHQTVLTHFA